MPRSSFSEAYRAAIKLLADARKAKGITQTSLAMRLGKPQSFVAKFERYERRLDIAEYIAVSDAIGLPRCDTFAALTDNLPHPIVL